MSQDLGRSCSRVALRRAFSISGLEIKEVVILGTTGYYQIMPEHERH